MRFLPYLNKPTQFCILVTVKDLTVIHSNLDELNLLTDLVPQIFNMYLCVKKSSNTYKLVVLMAMKSLKEHEQTNEAEIQKAEASGGCVLPAETTQPNAT